jgi:putative sterol carrier protein
MFKQRMIMIEKTIPELMDSIPRYFVSEKASGIDAVIQFHLTGNQGGDWIVTIQNKSCQVNKGVAEEPNLTLTAEAQDCLDILSGKLDGLRAYMAGKLKVKGNMGLAMKIAGFFRMDQ